MAGSPIYRPDAGAIPSRLLHGPLQVRAKTAFLLFFSFLFFSVLLYFQNIKNILFEKNCKRKFILLK
jgi:hypothetical protein